MNKILLTITIVLFASACNFNGKDKQVLEEGFVNGEDIKGIILPDDSTKWTSIEWLDTTKTLNITDEKEVEIAFRFKNVGKLPLSINTVKASCGCTSTSKPANTVAPGEEDYVKAIFNPKGREGINQKIVTVITNTKERVTSLKFTATVSKKN